VFKLRMMSVFVFGMTTLILNVAQAEWGGINAEAAKILALKPNLEKGLVLYETNCAACHEMEGWGSMYGNFPQLAGQHQSVLVKQLLDMRDGKRQNPAMKKIFSENLFRSTQDFADVTAYVSSLPMTGDNGRGNGAHVVQGKKIYTTVCMGCHGEYAEGNEVVAYPLLQSQHYSYMLGQFKAIKTGLRGNADPIMMSLIQGFTDEEVKAVLDYVSRIKPPKHKRDIEHNLMGVLDQLRSY